MNIESKMLRREPDEVIAQHTYQHHKSASPKFISGEYKQDRRL
jgi:hypothetical protein